MKLRAGAIYGKGEALLDPSPLRTGPDCPVWPKCGGCTLRHVTYAGELDFKLQLVNDAYRRIGGLDLRAETILGAASPATPSWTSTAAREPSPSVWPGAAAG